MKIIKKLHTKEKIDIDGEEVWEDQVVKLDINSATHGMLSGDRVDMQFGGRNLFTANGWEFYSSYATLVSYDGTKSLIFKETLGAASIAIKNEGYVTTSGRYIMSGFLKIDGEIPEEDYFLNITTRSSQDTVERTYNPTTGYFTVSQVVDYYSWTIHASVRGRTLESNRTIEISNIKYEKGNVATDWTPAPEDALQLTEIMKAIYPIGSIYTSVVNTNPGTLFGGTWAAFAAGRTIVGIDTGQTEFNASEKAGGSKTHTITTAQLPAHSHTATTTVASGGAHTHTTSGTAASNGAHTHTVSGTAASAGSHTHQNRGYFSTTGGHATQLTIATRQVASDPVQDNALLAAGAHTHTISGTAASNGAHTHTTSGTAASAGAHAHTATTSIADSGSGSAINILQPYVTVYMWKRTA